MGMTKAESRKLPHGSNKKCLPYAIIVYGIMLITVGFLMGL